MSPNPLIYLASASPRRRQLLDQIGVRYEVRVAAIDESPVVAEAPALYVERLARAKTEAVRNRLSADESLPVLGADTTVAIGRSMLGKPATRNEGMAMLRQLSGRTHQVFTAVALKDAAGCRCRVNVSDVTFRPLTDAECAAYWETGEPRDKAGGYAVQGLAAAFITRIAGSYSGIMGLPLAETAELLAEIGWGFGLEAGGLGLGPEFTGLETGGWGLEPEGRTKPPEVLAPASSPQPPASSEPQPPAPSPQSPARGASR